MNRILLISCLFIGITIMQGCSTEPAPIVFGTDVCSFCKMTLVDQKFGAELVTTKGKVYKFDDANCFMNFYHADYESPEQYAHVLVVDYAAPGKLIPAREAYYVKSPEIRSPMDGQVAGFADKGVMEKFKKEWKGIYLSWGEFVTEYK